jgi:hypothetical protein
MVDRGKSVVVSWEATAMKAVWLMVGCRGSAGEDMNTA